MFAISARKILKTKDRRFRCVLGRPFRVRGCRRIKIGDPDDLQKVGGASAPMRHRSFALSVTQIDLDDPNGLQQLPRFLRRDVEA